MTLVRAFLAMSLDGFVAGPDDGLGWLEPRAASAPPVAEAPWSDTPADALDFATFMESVGCIVMGRRTYDIVTEFPEWPYGDTPLVVVTHRPLEPARASVTAAAGPLAGIVEAVRATAGSRDVYVDGATIVRDALDARLLDDLVVTLVPTVLGAGVALFDRARPAVLTVRDVVRYGDGLVQLHLRAPHAVGR